MVTEHSNNVGLLHAVALLRGLFLQLLDGGG